MSNIFQFPDATPSTPAKPARNPFGQSHPSTTPAGPPPPSSHGSLTPAGAPPAFGNSSFFNHNQSLFGASQDSSSDTPKKQPLNFSDYTNFSPSPVKPAFTSRLPKSKTSPSSPGMFGRVSRPPARSALSQELGLSTASYASDASEFVQEPEQHNRMTGINDDRDQSDDDYDGRDSYYDGRDSRISRGSRYNQEYSADEDMDNDDPSQSDSGSHESQTPVKSRKVSSPQEPYSTTLSQTSDFMLHSPNRPQLSESQLSDYNFRDSKMYSTRSSRVQRPDEPIYGKIATDMGKRAGIAKIVEADKIILETESLINKLYSQDTINASTKDEILDRALSVVPKELISLWVQHDESIRLESHAEYASAIGPGQKASRYASAQFLSSLLLMLHQPPAASPPNFASQSISNNLALSMTSSQTQLSSVPSILLAWMYENHDPFPSQLAEIREHKPSPSAHPYFWETILNSLLRGKVLPVMNALEEAGWENLDASDDDSNAGRDGDALENIKHVIDDAVRTIAQCPGGQENWSIESSDWTLFRLKVQQALENLKMYTEGRSGLPDMRQVTGKSISATTRRAKSRIPWTLYQRLTTLYNLMLGDSLAIIETSQDWCEATIGLVLWGNLSNDEQRHGLGRSQYKQSSKANMNDGYADRIADAFYTATESDDFEVNPISVAEVGLAAIFEGEIKSVITLIQSCSAPIAAAVVEIASLGGWLPHAATQNLISMDSFDADDMDVLGLDGSAEESQDIKDTVLISYAQDLSHKDTLSYVDGKRKKISRDGWEIAVRILGRLNSIEESEKEVDHIIEDFPLDSSTAIDKLSSILNYLGLSSQAEKIAEKYADSLADSTRKYGEALWYYALAHKSRKVRDVLDLLISYSLIHSTAWPPTSELDQYLSTIISSPKAELARLSDIDSEAAELLHDMLSGYATLRTFYNLRDHDINPLPQFSKLSPEERKTQAASALIAVLASSDDNIRGGLYDPSRNAVVSIDFLIALLGETMPFIMSPSPDLTTSQVYTVLKTIEDLHSISPTLRASLESFLQTVIASGPGVKGSNPMDLLTKTTTGSSDRNGSQESFSLVSSSMAASQFQKSLGATKVSKSDIKRGWDWRDGVKAGMTGEVIVRMLRFGIAKELARCELIGF